MTQMHYQIIRMAKGGFGVSCETGKTFFVEGALPDESGEAEIIEEKERFGRCRAMTREKDSPFRLLENACPCASECDGCGFRHVRPEAALELKAAAIYAEILKMSHLSDVPWAVAPLSSSLDGTRRRVRIHVSNGQTGYFARGSHRIISASQCVVIAKPLQMAIASLEQNLPAFPHAQFEIQLDLDDSDRAFACFKLPENRILKKHQHRPGMKNKPATPDFDLNLLIPFAQKSVSDGMFAGIRIGEKVFGESWIRDVVKVSGIATTTWRRIGDFAQATPEGNAHIHRLIDEFLLREKPSFVADLYAGSGNLTFRAATRVRHVEGFEFFCDMNAFERGKSDNSAVFMPDSDVKLSKYDLSQGLPKSAAQADVLICDPARDGLSERIASDICHSNVQKLLYVSCEASCLARDLARLAPAFKPEHFTFIDMFPQTPHVETVCVLARL